MTMPKIRKLIPSEDQEQTALVQWLEIQKIVFYAIPNGGFRNLLEAAKLKRCGVQSGVPDLCIPIPSGSYNGLYLELKKLTGKATENQLIWQALLRSNGYMSEIAKGFDEAKAIVLNYLKPMKPAA